MTVKKYDDWKNWDSESSDAGDVFSSKILDSGIKGHLIHQLQKTYQDDRFKLDNDFAIDANVKLPKSFMGGLSKLEYNAL